KLTTKAQEALQAMQPLDQERGHQALEPEHLLLALLDQRDGVVVATLQKMNVQVDLVRGELEKTLEKRPQVSGSQPYMSRELLQVLDNAEAQAKALQDEYTSTEHFLLALAKDAKSDAGKILARLGVTSDGILKALASVRGSQRVTDPDPESK